MPTIYEWGRHLNSAHADHMLALCEVIIYADGFLPQVDQKEMISNQYFPSF